MTNQMPTGTATAKLNNGAFNTPTIFSRAELLQGFTDADNDPLRVALVTTENGNLTENANDTFTFTPDNGFSGVVSIDYVISDNNGGEINAMQSFNISAANQAPTGSATTKLADGKANVAYTIQNADLLQGFSDADNDLLRVALVTAENGEIRDNNNGTFTFTPDKDASGLVTLDYVISDNNGGEINASQSFNLIADAPPVAIATNHAPTGAASANLASGTANTNYTINAADLLQGFRDADKDTLSISNLTATNGKLTANFDNTWTFTPTANYNGLVNLNYNVIDGKNGTVNGWQSFVLQTATAPITNIENPVEPIEQPTNTPTDENHRATGEVIIEGTLKVGKVLTLLNSIDDEDGVGDFNYQWLSNGQPIKNAIQETYKLTKADAGKKISVAIDYVDALNNNESKTSLETEKVQVGIVINGFTAKTKPATKDADKIIGAAKNDELTGLAGNDTLRGEAGNDILNGNEGNDSLDGGNGNNELYGDDGNDILNGGSGQDLLEGGNGDDKLTGNAGNDTLNGGVGADKMDGGAGDDYYVVDNVKDSVTETDKNLKTGGNDTIETSLDGYVLGKNLENLVLAGIKNINGSGNELANTITGNVGDNILNGGIGNDKLMGGRGADQLDGGLGVDTLIGGENDDTYLINNLEDKIVEDKNGGENDQILSSVTVDLGRFDNIEILTLSAIKTTKELNGTGDAFNNVLQEKEGGVFANDFNGAAGNDTINGEGGDDTLEGGAGNDVLDGGDGNDIAVFAGNKDDYEIKPNIDVENQFIISYVGNDETVLDGTDYLNSVEMVRFADGDSQGIDIVGLLS